MKTQEEIEQLTNDLYLQKTEAIANIDIRGYIVSATKGGFIDGYIQCQKDMADKKYTEEDMRKCWDNGRKNKSKYQDERFWKPEALFFV